MKNTTNTQGFQGTGAVTGARYNLIQVNNGHINLRQPFPDEFTQVLTFKVVGGQGAPDFTLRIFQHFTRNANGEFTSEKVLSQLNVNKKE